jgi:hypothetical protein
MNTFLAEDGPCLQKKDSPAVTIQHPALRKILDMVFRVFLKNQVPGENLRDLVVCRFSSLASLSPGFARTPGYMV